MVVVVSDEDTDVVSGGGVGVVSGGGVGVVMMASGGHAEPAP